MCGLDGGGVNEGGWCCINELKNPAYGAPAMVTSPRPLGAPPIGGGVVGGGGAVRDEEAGGHGDGENVVQERPHEVQPDAHQAAGATLGGVFKAGRIWQRGGGRQGWLPKSEQMPELPPLVQIRGTFRSKEGCEHPSPCFVLGRWQMSNTGFVALPSCRGDTSNPAPVRGERMKGAAGGGSGCVMGRCAS